MKQCPKCKKTLPSSAFNRSSQTRDGLRMYCRQCEHIAYRAYANSPQGKATKKAWNESEKGKRIMLQSDRKRNKTEHRRKYKREIMCTPKYRKLKNAWLNKYRSRPEQRIKIKAGYTVRNALRRGDIERGPCELAYTGECYGNPQAHHDDYSKPFEIRWLCPRHHMQIHRG